MRKRVAIIGGGVAGLTAGYLLHEHYDVTLFERSERIGGNAYTLATPDGGNADIAACGFGKYSYTNLFRLFSKLGIETEASCRSNPFSSLGLTIGFQDLETKKGLYMTPGLSGLIAQRFALLKPAQLNAILSVMKGMKRASTALDNGHLEGESLDGAIKKIPELRGDAKLIFVGGLCLISSMYCPDVLDAPASFFIRKLKIHDDLIPPKAFFGVRFSKHGTRRYVEALTSGFRDKIARQLWSGLPIL